MLARVLGKSRAALSNGYAKEKAISEGAYRAHTAPGSHCRLQVGIMNAATPRRRRFGVPLEHPIEPADLMNASSRRHPFDDENWLYEIKFDGYRCLARKDGGEVRLLSREGNAFTPAFPEIANAVSGVRGNVVMDCELTVDDKRGHQLFETLQRRSRMSVPFRVRAAATECPARLFVFDLLATDSRDMRGLALLERKRLLRDVFDDSSLLVFVNAWLCCLRSSHRPRP
jgi:ATP-dependent DNA ligase